jgi:hypothetical protein
MKWSVIIVGAVFAVALAVVIGSRMSADATAVMVGVVCGIGASVPTCLLLVWALVRRAQGMSAGAQVYGRNGSAVNYPPVVVVNPGYGAQSYGPALGMVSPPPGQLAGASGQLIGGSRTFKVVGDEETLEDSISGTLFG